MDASPDTIGLWYLCRWINLTRRGLNTMKVKPVDTTMPQPRQHYQQPSKPKPRSTNDDFKKIFEAELRKVNNEKH